MRKIKVERAGTIFESYDKVTLWPKDFGGVGEKNWNLSCVAQNAGLSPNSSLRGLGLFVPKNKPAVFWLYYYGCGSIHVVFKVEGCEISNLKKFRYGYKTRFYWPDGDTPECPASQAENHFWPDIDQSRLREGIIKPYYEALVALC